MDTLWQDLKYGARMLARRPGFTIVAVLTLALGIGANTAIFSLINTVFFVPLPFEDEARLLRVLDSNAAPSGEIRTVNVTPRNFISVRDGNRVFSGVMAQIPRSTSLTGSGEEPQRVGLVQVSAGWSSLLGIQPSLGRAFTPQEERQGADSDAVLLAYGLWQSRFGGDPGVLGRSINFDGRSHTVVGVMPQGFHYPYEADLWAPIVFDPLDGRSGDLNVVGRLKPGVTFAQARADLERIAGELAAAYPDTNERWGIVPVSFRDDLYGDDGKEQLAVLLLGVVGFFLLIACLNVASLLLARFVTRQKEVAVRAALGASGQRQVRQFLTESLLLSLLGGLAGVLLSLWTGPFLEVLIPPDLSRELTLSHVGIDGRVLAFTFLLTLLTGFFFGTIPAFKAHRADLIPLLKEGGRSTATGGNRRLLGGLVVGEIALAFILLTGAGLMIQNLRSLLDTSPGFDAHHLLTLRFSLEEPRFAGARERASLIEQVLAAVRHVPGVEEAGVTTVNPICCGDWGARVAIEGLPEPTGDSSLVINHRYVTPDLHRAMGIPLRRGRYFTEQDRVGSQPVVIIDERMARHFWPDEDPIGKRIKRAPVDSAFPWLTIVGVVGDVRDAGDYHDTWYLPFYQDPQGRSTDTIHLMIRSVSDPGALAHSIQQAIWEIDPRLALYETETMDRMYAETFSRDRRSTVLLTVFALFGLSLAALGIYGVLSYAVGHQTHEIGVRVTFGAQGGDIVRLVLWRGLQLVFAGLALGLLGAYVAVRGMSALLAGLAGLDPLALLAASGLLVFVALLACWIPARRATRVDPMVALRYE